MFFKFKRKRLKNGGNKMMNTQVDGRYCSISESLIESCKEVKLIREGKLPKKSWRDFRAELKNDEFLKPNKCSKNIDF